MTDFNLIFSSVQFAGLMWVLTYVGSLFNGLTILILGEEQVTCQRASLHVVLKTSPTLAPPGGQTNNSTDSHPVLLCSINERFAVCRSLFLNPIFFFSSDRSVQLPDRL